MQSIQGSQYFRNIHIQWNVLLTLALRICEDTFISQRDYMSKLIAGSERTSHMCEQLPKTNALDSFTSEEIKDTIEWLSENIHIPNLKHDLLHFENPNVSNTYLFLYCNTTFSNSKIPVFCKHTYPQCKTWLPVLQSYVSKTHIFHM